ncbi:MAG: glycosyltransferase family 39 protein [Planctomycetota bacterium]
MTKQAWLSVVILLALGAAVYGFKLGDGGFAYTEGHRVQPAYEMLDGENAEARWLVPRLFGRPYLRKPPGIQWLIAGSTQVFGRSEFSARAVSAGMTIGGGLLVFAFARRWYGESGGLASGVGYLLMPVLLEGGRAAEIEASHQLFVLLACLPMLDLLLYERDRLGLLRSAMVALGLFGMILTKGPAGLPVVGGVLLASWWVDRSAGVYKRASLWFGLAVGLGIAGLVYWWIFNASQQFDDVVLQSPGEFLFNKDKLIAILTLPALAFVAGLPCSIAAIFPFGPFAAREAAMSRAEVSRRRMALGVSWAFLIAVGIYMLSGVSNPRYTWPAVVLLPVTVGYVWVGLGERTFVRLRMVLGRVVMLGHPAVVLVVLLGVALAYPWTIEAERRGTSGDAVAGEINQAVGRWQLPDDFNYTPPTGDLHANGLVEVRVEAMMPVDWRIRWSTESEIVSALTGNGWALLRTDGSPSEYERIRVSVPEGLEVRFEGEVAGKPFVLVGRGKLWAPQSALE